MTRRRFAGRVLAALLFSFAIGWHIARDEARWHGAGKPAFMQYQSNRFDRFIARTPTPARTVGMAVVFAAGLGVYEAVAFAFTRFLSGPSASNRT